MYTIIPLDEITCYMFYIRLLKELREAWNIMERHYGIVYATLYLLIVQ